MGERRTMIDVGAVKRTVSIVDAVTAFVPGIELRRSGRTLVALSPFKAEKTPSFTIDPRKGVYFCFATDQGGDAIAFVQRIERIDFIAAVRRLAERCMGSVPLHAIDDAETKRRAEEYARQMAEIEARKEREQLGRIRVAQRIWGETWPAAGTLAQTYLESRGIDLMAVERIYGAMFPSTIRFHPALSAVSQSGAHVGPAMVARMHGPDGSFRGIHRTFLTSDGRGKARIADAKMTLGAMMGSMTALTHHDGCEVVGHAVSGEGIETTMTVISALARRGRKVVGFSAISLSNLAGRGVGHGEMHPAKRGKRLPSIIPDPEQPGLLFPEAIKRATLLRDADGADPMVTEARLTRAVAKFRARGMAVDIATPEAGCDFNDMVRARARSVRAA